MDRLARPPHKGDVSIPEAIRIFTDGGADGPTATHTLLRPVNGALPRAPVLGFSPCEMRTVGNSLHTGGNWGPQRAECKGTLA